MIPNEKLQKLTETMMDQAGAGALSPSTIQQAMWLAYQTGKVDGQIAMCEQLVPGVTAAAKAAS